MWTIALGFLRKWVWTKFLSKLPLKAFIVAGVIASAALGVWYVSGKFKTLKETNNVIVESLRVIQEQNKTIKKINLTNQKNYETIIAYKDFQNNLTKDLIKRISEIENVTHTKEIVIREAEGECLDTPYPLDVYSTFLWGEQEEASGDSSRNQ